MNLYLIHTDRWNIMTTYIIKKLWFLNINSAFLLFLESLLFNSYQIHFINKEKKKEIELFLD